MGNGVGLHLVVCGHFYNCTPDTFLSLYQTIGYSTKRFTTTVEALGDNTEAHNKRTLLYRINVICCSMQPFYLRGMLIGSIWHKTISLVDRVHK